MLTETQNLASSPTRPLHLFHQEPFRCKMFHKLLHDGICTYCPMMERSRVTQSQCTREARMYFTPRQQAHSGGQRNWLCFPLLSQNAWQRGLRQGGWSDSPSRREDWRQEREEASHTASTVGKQGASMAKPAFSF